MFSKIAPISLLIAGTQAVGFQAAQPAAAYLTTGFQMYECDANLNGRLVARSYSGNRLTEWDQSALKFFDVPGAPPVVDVAVDDVTGRIWVRDTANKIHRQLDDGSFEITDSTLVFRDLAVRGGKAIAIKTDY